MIRLALITNIPPPYRIPIFNLLAAEPNLDFHVIFFSRKEPNRSWDLPALQCKHYFLHERFVTYKGRYIHCNPDILSTLQKISPDLIINDGFNPTHLLAFLYALVRHIPHIPMTDGTDQSEKNFSLAHKVVRKMVYKKSAAFISASLGGTKLYESYGIDTKRCFHSYLCVDNEKFYPYEKNSQKIYDFIFCSRLDKEKNPEFSLHVAQLTAMRLKRKIHMLIVGSGPEERNLQTLAQQYAGMLNIHFHGFASQNELPELYRSASVFLFPTQADVWGIVVNEAAAAGLPIITTPYAGVVNELVIDNQNAYVRKLCTQAWADCAINLLTDQNLYKKFSANSISLVKKYNFKAAANGVLRAAVFARTASQRSSSVLKKPNSYLH